MRQLVFAKPAAIRFGSDYVSDHGRDPVQIEFERIEERMRTQRGRLRKYFRADKRSFNLSWSQLPQNSEYTVDAAWGAEDIQLFHQSTTDSFMLTLTYDEGVTSQYEVVLTDFSMSLNSRLGDVRRYDVSLVLEEV